MSDSKKIENLEKKVNKMMDLIESLSLENEKNILKIKHLKSTIKELNQISLSNIQTKKTKRRKTSIGGMNLTWKRSRDLKYIEKSSIGKEIIEDNFYIEEQYHLSITEIFEALKILIRKLKKIEINDNSSINIFNEINILTNALETYPNNYHYKVILLFNLILQLTNLQDLNEDDSFISVTEGYKEYLFIDCMEELTIKTNKLMNKINRLLDRREL